MGVHETIVSTSNTINVISIIIIIWACLLITRRFGVLLLLHAVGSALISVNAGGTFDVALRSQWKLGRRPVLVVPVILLAQLSSHIDWPFVLLFMRLSGHVGRI